MNLQRRFQFGLGVLAIVLLVGGLVQGYIHARNDAVEHAYEECQEILSDGQNLQAYVSGTLRPIMVGLVGEDGFIPEAMSGTYVSRHFLEDSLASRPSYRFKFASLNPRNPVNAPDETEQAIIEVFRSNPGLKEWKGEVLRDGRACLMVATPIVMDEACMRCHSTPDRAPKALLARYGDTLGFGLSVGDVAIRSATVPLADVNQRALAHAFRIYLPFLFVFGFLYLGSNVFFARLVGRPIRKLESGLSALQAGDFNARIDMDDDSEVGRLGNAFNRMAAELGEAIQARERNMAEIVRGRDEWMKTFDAVSDLIAIIDTEYRIVRANRAMADAFGMDVRAFPGTPCYRLFHNLDAPPDCCPHAQLLRTGQGFSAEAYEAHLGKHLLVSVSPLFDEKGDVTGSVHVVRDITERKQAELMIQRSNEILENVFSSSSFLIAYLDRDFNFIRVNHAYAEADGRPASFFEGRNHFDLYPDEENEAIFSRVVATGEPYSAVAKPFVYAEHPERGIIFWDWNLLPVSDSVTGGVKALTLFLVNVTEKVRSAEALQVSRLRYYQLFNGMADGVFDADTQGTIALCNPSFARIHGYSRSNELIGKRMLDFAAPDVRTAVEDAFLQDMTSGVVRERLEFPIVRADGVRAWIQVRPTGVYEGGCLVGVRGLVRDVTSELNVAEQLEKGARFLQDVIDGISESVMVIGTDYRVRMMNRTARQFCGDHFGEHDGFCYRLSHGQDEPCSTDEHPCPLKEVVQSGRGTTVVHAHKAVDGSERTIELTATPVFNPSGHVECVIEVGRDITERLRLEEEGRRLQARIFQQQKAESIATLAGGIAHEYNNILMGVMGFAELFEMTATTEKSRQYARSVIQGTERMAHLTRQLLAYAEGGKYVPVVLDLNRVVRDAMDVVPQGRGGAIETRLRLEPGLWFVQADRGQMDQVMINLLDNAFEALEQKPGTVELITKNESFDKSWHCGRGQTMPPGDYVHVGVSDSGPGVPIAEREKVFEPFCTTKFLGRGLGLAAVAGIVQNHGGCVFVDESELGGAAFHVYLPKAVGTVQAERPAVAPAAELHPPRPMQATVLVVDDEPHVLDAVREFLVAHGLIVLTASDGDASLQQFKEHAHRVAVVILDIMMPGMSGRDVYRRLKELKPGVRVIVSSGYDQESALQGTRLDAGDVFVQKPYSLGELLGMIMART